MQQSRTDTSEEDVKLILETLYPDMRVEATAAGPVPAYEEDSMVAVRGAMMVEYDKMSDTFGLMTDDITKVKDWERLTYATAGAWGLAATEYAMYAPYALPNANADTCYVATYDQPIVNQF